MTLTYRPTRKMVGDNARSLEFELRKIQQKIQQMDSLIDANRLNIFGKRD
jgi:hypothetical protein